MDGKREVQHTLALADGGQDQPETVGRPAPVGGSHGTILEFRDDESAEMGLYRKGDFRLCGRMSLKGRTMRLQSLRQAHHPERRDIECQVEVPGQRRVVEAGDYVEGVGDEADTVGEVTGAIEAGSPSTTWGTAPQGDCILGPHDPATRPTDVVVHTLWVLGHSVNETGMRYRNDTTQEIDEVEGTRPQRPSCHAAPHSRRHAGFFLTHLNSDASPYF